MELPSTLILTSLKEGKIYFFTEKTPIGVANHFHICAKKNGQTLIFTYCTSKEATVNRFLVKQRISSETVVYIPKDTVPVLPKDTFVNCNNVYPFPLDEFCRCLNNGEIVLKGEIDESICTQIVNGIMKSPLIADEIKEMMRMEETNEE
jgi:hypothetical protein